MVPFASRLRVCQLFDMVDTNPSFHEHCVVKMQHLHADTTHQEWNGFTILPLCDDGWFGSHEPRAYYRTSHAV